jgi:hypothetical protein
MPRRIARWARLCWAFATLEDRPLDQDGRPVDTPTRYACGSSDRPRRPIRRECNR